jgi:two-component system cell cycle response regulator DivK
MKGLSGRQDFQISGHFQYGLKLLHNLYSPRLYLWAAPFSLISPASLSVDVWNKDMSAKMRARTEEVPARTILVVDDFDDTRLMMRLWLQKRGYRVIEAADGLQALEVARRESPHLVIMDIEMPEMDGLAATRQIRSEEGLRDVPIVAVSAYGEEHWRDRALEAGCNEYVSTPFEPKELDSLIKSLLR